MEPDEPAHDEKCIEWLALLCLVLVLLYLHSKLAERINPYVLSAG